MEKIGGIPAFVRRHGDARVLYLHGLASTSDEWLALLERVGGVAPDLPGFGRTGKGGDRAYAVEEYANWLEHLVADWPGLTIVGREWGARFGDALARRLPDRVDRLLVLEPELPSGRRARMWPRQALGELAMALTTRWNPIGPRQAWPFFDQGTQRAVLRLYRSAPVAPLSGRAQIVPGTLSDPGTVDRLAADLGQ